VTIPTGSKTSLTAPFDADGGKSNSRALPTREELWETLVSALADFVVVVDREGRILYRNRAVAGFTAEDARATLLDYVEADESDKVPPVLQRVFGEGYKHYGEVNGPGPNGTTSRYAVCIAPVVQAGTTIAAMVTAKDVTGERTTESLLREREALLRSTMDTANTGVIVVYSDGRVAFANSRLGDLWRIPRELIDAGESDAIREAVLSQMQDPDAFLSLGAASFKDPGPLSGDIVLTDGRVYEYSARALLQDDTIVARAWSFRDVTGRLDGQRKLRQSEERLVKAQQVARLGSWSWDIDTDELYWSDEMHRIFETSGELRTGWEPAVFDRVHPDDKDLISGAFLRGLGGATSQEPIEFRVVHTDGSQLHVVAEATADFDERGIPIRVFGTVQDITARKRVELALEARMQRAAALAELGQRALTERDPQVLIDEAVVLVARTLAVDFSNVLQLYQDEGVLRVLTAAGQRGPASPVGITIPADSHAGYTIRANGPVIVEDLRTESRFTPSERLLSSGVISHVCVVIHGPDGPWGVLAAHTRKRRTFTENEGHFLQNVANVLGSALARARAEVALRESEERFRRIAGNVQDIIFRFRMEPTAGIEYISPAAEAISGRALQEFYDDPELTHNMTHPDDRGTLAKAFFDGTTEQTTVRWVRPDGRTVWVEYRNNPVRDREGNLIAVEGVIRDVTEIILMQEALQQRREDLEARVEERFPSGNDYGLTFREMTVLQLIVTGRADKEIGQHLGISPTTVHKHVASILDKMKAGSRTEAGVRALREGLVI
jgi:PAS domain S-box-containing protein